VRGGTGAGRSGTGAPGGHGRRAAIMGPMPDHAIYTHGHHESVLRAHTWRTVENSAAYLVPHLKPGRRVLDIGCGPGTITADLARRVAPGQTIGIDAAPGVIEIAARDHQDSPAIFETGDVTDLRFADATFDIVHAHQVLQHLADPVAALVEMRRVCRPDGVVAARDGDYGSFTWYPADPGLDRWLTTYEAVSRANGGEPDAGRHLAAWARRAGFRQVIPSASVWCFAEPGDRAWWGDLWAERITVSPLAERAVQLGLAAPADLAEMADAWRRWSADVDGWFAVLHGEVLCRP
jgi:SAM-dependent methyltransferase